MSVRVAVIDSGWDPRRVEPRVAAGCSFFHRLRPLKPDLVSGSDDLIGHGTACIRIILTCAPTIEVVPLRIFYRRLETSPAVLVHALEWAREYNFDVINLSLSTPRDDVRDALYVQCELLHRAGAVLVAATQNLGGRGYPAVFDNVLSVDADQDECASRTIRRIGVGAHFRVGAFALGDMIGMPLGPVEGTSYRAALISGLIGAMMKDGRLTLEQVCEQLSDENTIEKFLLAI